MKVFCKVCKKEYYRRKHKSSKEFYCSSKCYFSDIKDNVASCGHYGHKRGNIFLCLNCKKENYRYPSSNRIFCNHSCKVEYVKNNPMAASNYRGGTYVKCIYCGKEKFRYNNIIKAGIGKYCSVKCYMEDPNSPNRSFGENNPMSNSTYREHVKNGVRNHIKKYDYDGKRTGKKEKHILDLLEKKFNILILRHYRIGKYTVDGFIKELNTVIEVDERYHLRTREMKKNLLRDNFLINECNCKVLHIRSYVEEDVENARI